MGKGPGPLWRRPRYIPEVPGKPAKAYPDAKKERPGRSESTPSRSKSTPSHFQEPKNQSFSTLLVRVSSSERSFVEFDRFFVGPQSLRTLESTAPASKNRGSARCAARPAAHATATRKITKIDPGTDHFECIWHREASDSAVLSPSGSRTTSDLTVLGAWRPNVGFRHPRVRHWDRFQCPANPKSLVDPKPSVDPFV